MAPFNLKHFEKIAEDEDTATLRHPRGHEIIIAVRSLPKIQREAIRRLKLSDGGKVEKSEGMSEQGRDVRYARKQSGEQKEMAKDFARKEAKGRADFERLVKPKMQGLADGGPVKYKNPELAEKGRESLRKKSERTPEEKAKNDAFWEQADRELKRLPAGKRKNYDEGSKNTVEQNDSDMDENKKEIDSNADEVSKEVGEAEDAGKKLGQSPVAPITINVGSPGPTYPVNQNPQPIPESPKIPQMEEPKSPQPAGSPIQQEAQKTLNAYDRAQAALKNKAAIESSAAQQSVPIEQQKLEREKEIANFENRSFQAMSQHTDDFANHVKDIDINRYQDRLGSTKKITNAIGLFLGGLGTPFGGHNYAFDFLNKQIDRDIAAQQQDIENQKSVYSAYHQLYGDSQVAAKLSRASLDQVYSNQMKVMAAQLGTAQAYKNFQEGAAKLMTDSIQQRQEAASILGNKYRNGTLGAPQAPGAQPPEKKDDRSEKEKHPLQYGILVPDAETKWKEAKFSPIFKDQYGELTRQYGAAKQAEVNLKQLNDIFMKASKAVEEAGKVGRTRSGIQHGVAATMGALGSLLGPGAGVAGTGVGEAVGNSGKEIFGRDVDRQVDNYKTQMFKILSTALKNTNAGSGDLNHLVETSMPVYGDEPKTKAEKLKGMRDAVINSLDKGLLTSAGIIVK